MAYIIYETEDYKIWFKSQTLKSQRQILSRLLKITEENYFGHNKLLDNAGIWELKFNDGRRVYYVLIEPRLKILLLLGGNKNGQDKDIKKATAIFRKIREAGSK